MTAPAAVTPVGQGRHQIAYRVVVPVPAGEVFALVADPRRHAELDGSGTVRDAPVNGPERLSDGARFTVAMKQYGVPYRITSTVTAFVEDRVVEWQHPAGHRWRWELEPLDDRTTWVTETFDYRDSKSPRLLEVLRQPAKNAVGITESLRRLAARYR